MTSFRKSPLVALMLAATAATALAQGGECTVDLNRPGQVKDAWNAALTSELAGRPEDKKKALARAVGLLTKDMKRFESNMAGRNLALGRVLVDLSALDDMPQSVRRGDVGYTDNPDGMVDLVLAADTALDAVDGTNTACQSETEEVRRKAYAPLVNLAVNAYNEHNIDSAETVARRAIEVYGNYPLSYIALNVLGNSQQTKDDNAGAIKSFRRMVELMKGDTSLTEERKTNALLVASLMTSEGEKLEGEARKNAMSEVVAYLGDYLKEFPGDVQAQSAEARAQLLSGDAATARKLFDDMSSSPDKYTDMQLFEAGVGASRAELNESAAKLFEEGLKKNPYSRDGLFNLAAVYDNLGETDKMPAVLNRLIAIDPENPDNYQLWARYYQARAKALKPAADAKKDPVADAAWQAANDSLFKAYSRYSDATVRVSFNVFSHDSRDKGHHTLAGSIENRSDQPKSYALKIDFMDASGTVLDSREVPVDSVEAKGSKSFRVEVTDKPGIVAFKYAPFPQ